MQPTTSLGRIHLNLGKALWTPEQKMRRPINQAELDRSFGALLAFLLGCRRLA